MKKQGAKGLIREIPKALLNWYPFKPDARILYIGEKDPYGEALEECGARLSYVSIRELKGEGWQAQPQGYFDYAVCVGQMERDPDPADIFAVVKKALKQEGVFLAGMNNRLGLRYFCGDRDPYTGRNFDGVEDYRRAYVKEEDTFQGRMYDREQIRQMLFRAGWKEENVRFFAVLTDLGNPSFIYAQDSLPNEDLSNRVFSTYGYPDTVFLDEEPLYQALMENGMFHPMANAYLVECAPVGKGADVSHVTASMERGREKALLTIIHKPGTVEKRAAYPEGQKQLEGIVAHGEDLKAHGLAVVDAQMVDGACRMPYIRGETGQLFLKRLLQTDRKAFFERLDHFRDLLLQSSEVAIPDRGDGEGAILKKGYLDLVPLNSFYVDGEFVFFDQEFCEGNCPANLLIQRMISTLYAGDAQMHKLLPMEQLYGRYGMAEGRQRWQAMEWEFLRKLLKQKELRIYHESCRKNPDILHANRHRMNYSEMDYQRLFVDVFKGVEGRKLILFGSGIFAQRFLGMYGNEYPIGAVVDNKESRWGEKLGDIAIQSPDLLKGLKEGEYKVIVCIKNFLSVIKQLEEMGIKHYSIFDPGKSYLRRQAIAVKGTGGEALPPKKYQVGYVAGVFDMFHVGHVNLLRKAKEQCSYLIVGVVSDEGAYGQKKKYPVIPCEDRMEMLRSCRYVDQVEELPPGYGTIQDAYKKFHFDCMFSGDDHGNDEGWMADKAFLEKSGVDMVFFQYTKKVSSTKLRQQLGGHPDAK